MNLVSILNGNKNISSLQIICIKGLVEIFDESRIEEFSYEDYFYDGTFGQYQGKEVYAVDIKFRYKFYDFEFILAYNQLEYFISRESKIIFECNLEDFWEENVLAEKYLNFLRIDLNKING